MPKENQMQTNRSVQLDTDSVERFITWLEARGRSENTCRAYASDLHQFLLVMGPVPRFEFEDKAMAWLNTTRKDMAPKTTGRRLTSLRGFAKWAGWEQVLTDYSTPTPAKPVPHPLPEGIDGVRRMLAVAKYDDERALIALCGLCGLRVAEALAVIPPNFDLTNMTLTIRGKGDKSRIVPVSKEAWNMLAPSVTRAYCGMGPGTVVGMYDRQARRCVTRLGKKANLKRHISSHDLRATFATAVYDKTMDIRLVQDLLGHSSVETTQVYTGVGLAKMKEGVEGL
jgi:site-specific recombinase XerD